MVFILQLALFGLFYFIASRRFRHGEPKPSGIKPGYEQHISRYKGKINGRHLFFMGGGSFPFIVTRERFYHRWLKAWGIAHEVSSGDEGFDHHLYFVTDHSEHLARALRSEPLRQALRKLFRCAKAFHSEKGKGWAVVRGKDIKEDEAFFVPYWEVIEEIQQEVAKISAPDVAEKKAGLKPLALLVMIVHMALFFTAVSGFAPTLLENYEITHYVMWGAVSLSVGCGVAALWFLAIMHFFRNTSWIAMVLADFFLFGVVGILLCSAYIVREADIHFDTREPEVVARQVVGSSCTVKCGTGKRSRIHSLPRALCLTAARGERPNLSKYKRCYRVNHYSYYVYASHWRAGQEPYKFPVPAMTYLRTNAADVAYVPVHRGALNVEWVDTDAIQILNR